MGGRAIGVGDLVADKYLVLESLGTGGMSNVWLARDERLGKLWAIKEIKPNVSGSRGEALRQAIVDEANFMKRLDHPAIPRVVDIIDTGATIFVIMDYVDGRSLAELQRVSGKAFDQDDVIAWGIELCDVLGYLHHCTPPVVYRDMKPANVMVRDDGSIRLIDFGIAMECDPQRNNDGRVVGTPGFAPPEQLPDPMPWPMPTTLDEDSVVDARADVYALGCTLYTLVTGHAPKLVEDGQGHPKVSFAMRPIRVWDAHLSEGLERIILRATRRNAAERYQTIDEMRYDLEHYEELTEAWRSARQRKLHTFKALLATALACTLTGAVCLWSANAVRQASYDDLMHEASAASRESVDEQPSQAERLYMQAIALAPGRLEPYRRLLEVYEDDYRLNDGEAHRWQKAYGRARDIANDPAFAQLCFDVGTCYLCYYGVDYAGGSVGNVALQSMGAAAPWFARALEADDASGGSLGESDRRSAEAYGIIAGFYEQVTRSGREGRGSLEQYGRFWQSLTGALMRENAVADAHRSPEGVRVRLCQAGVEVLSSSTYLAAMARAGVSSQQARELLQAVRDCVAGMDGFVRAPEYAEVYGPVFELVEQGLGLAERNIENTYDNPVAGMPAPSDRVREDA